MVDCAARENEEFAATLYPVPAVPVNGIGTAGGRGEGARDQWVELTVDSGAGDSVADPRVWPGQPAVEAARRLVTCLGPAGE